MKTLPSAREDTAATDGDPLEMLGVSTAAARIIRYYLIRPDARPHARVLQRLLHLGGASIQRELRRMVALGLLAREEEGRQVHYSAKGSSPAWTALRMLESASKDPTVLVRDALIDVQGIQAAFLFGSTARGTQRDDSDIDLFVLEEPTVDSRKSLRQLAEVEMLVSREINVIRYTPQTLGLRLGDPKHPAWRFVRETLMGPKVWIAGAASAIAPLAAAGALRCPDLGERC